MSTRYYRPEEIRDPVTGKWINSSVFREEGLKFMKNGYYCPDPVGSLSWKQYWDEQLRRCNEGYEVAGYKITGHHYEYLNFSQIEIVDQVEDTIVSKKETKMPDFWDGDFDYFWCLEIAKNGVANKDSLLATELEKQVWKTLPDDEQQRMWVDKVGKLHMHVKPHPEYLGGGNHMIVGKSRRKGYSYKNASICANTYNTTRKALTVIGAFDKKYLYPKGTMGMASAYLSFINKHTAWSKAREYVDKQEHKRASFVEVKEGIKIESGYMSEIMALTFADNPDAARGKDALFVLLEEAGKFPNLKASYEATKPGLTAGKYITGQIIIFGTGGDMESGTMNFAEMFYNPIQFGLMPFINIWDENAENSYCGFFHPVYLNMEGFYDDQGNSDIDAAIAYEKSERERIKKAATSSMVLQARVQEYPMCPSEAFLTVSVNDFPVVELRAQYNRVIRESLHLKYGQAVYLMKEVKEVLIDGEMKLVSKVKAKPDLDGTIQPLWDYKIKTPDTRGGVVIYEYPMFNPPRGLYKIGFDPYRQVLGESMAAIYVYKGADKFSYSRNTIVAQYVGRPYDPDDVNRIAALLAELYNAEVMHENEVTHVKNYFQKAKKLHLLARQPDQVIKANVDNSKAARTYGIHMVEKLKDAGEKYIKQWLLEERDFDENGNAILNLNTIYDPALLDELVLYNRKGNFDRVMAFMMVMFQCEEDGEKEYNTSGEDKEKSVADELLEMMDTQYKKN
jgi:hypothetical protein